MCFLLEQFIYVHPKINLIDFLTGWISKRHIVFNRYTMSNPCWKDMISVPFNPIGEYKNLVAYQDRGNIVSYFQKTINYKSQSKSILNIWALPTTPQVMFLCPISLCRRMDLHHRRRKPSDLQSLLVDYLSTTAFYFSHNVNVLNQTTY